MNNKTLAIVLAKWPIFVIALLVLLQLAALLFIRNQNYSHKVEKNISAVVPETRKHDNLIEGEFRLEVNLPMNKHTLVRYIVPVDETGRPQSSASNMVFYAPYNGDEVPRHLHQWVRTFAEVYGYTVFSLTIITNLDFVQDETHYYLYPTSGWHEVVFSIQEYLQREYGLKKKKLIVVGQSSGGSFAQQLIAAHPDRISRAAWNGGRLYKPFDRHVDTKILALNLWGCPGEEPTRLLHSNAMEYGIDMQRYVTPTPPRPYDGGRMFHHAVWKLQLEMIEAFATGNDLSPWLQKLPGENFGELPQEICKAPANSRGVVVFLWREERNRVSLKDLLWYSYNKNLTPSYICYSQDIDSIKKGIDDVRKYAERERLPMKVLAFPDERLKPLATGKDAAVLFGENLYKFLK